MNEGNVHSNNYVVSICYDSDIHIYYSPESEANIKLLTVDSYRRVDSEMYEELYSFVEKNDENIDGHLFYTITFGDKASGSIAKKIYYTIIQNQTLNKEYLLRVEIDYNNNMPFGRNDIDIFDILEFM